MEDAHFVWLRGTCESNSENSSSKDSSNDGELERITRRFHCSHAAGHSSASSPAGSSAGSPERTAVVAALAAEASGYEAEAGASFVKNESTLVDEGNCVFSGSLALTVSPLLDGGGVDMCIADPALLPNNAGDAEQRAAMQAELDALAADLPMLEAFVGVFDGHAGDAASKFLAQNLFRHILQQLRRLFDDNDRDQADNNSNTNNGHGGSSNQNKNYETLLASVVDQRDDDEDTAAKVIAAAFQSAFDAAFLSCDAALRVELAKNGGASGGSTAAGALITTHHIILFSVGDCRSAVFRLESRPVVRDDHDGDDDDDKEMQQQRQQQTYLAAETIVAKLDDDHKPSLPREAARLEKIGATVVNGRVGGKLAISRAFGDFILKPEETQDPRQYPVICLPDLSAVSRRRRAAAGAAVDEGLLIVIGCDGVWETQQLPAMGQLVLNSPTLLSGVAKIALRSVATMQPIDLESGGLLPGSDNVTFAAVAVPPAICVQQKRQPAKEKVVANRL